MDIDHAKVTLEIIEACGGTSNVLSATASGDTLRLAVKKPDRVDLPALEALPAVRHVQRAGSVVDLRLETEAPVVLRELQKRAKWAEDAPAAEKPQGNPVKRMFQFIAECMMPLLPAMLGAGMLKVVLALCTTFGWLTATQSTYHILYAFGDAFFQFLPIFLALSIARKNGGSAVLYMLVAASLCYSDLVRLMSGELQPLGTFLGLPCTYLFGLPVICATYTSSVLPMLLMAPVMKWAEGFADRISPTVVKSFLKPLLFIVICIPCVLYVLGPIGNLIGSWLAELFSAMYDAVPWLTVGVLSAIAPFLVMTGMHFALIPLMFNNIAALGYDVIMCVTMYCSNIAQGGAAFGVAARTRRDEIRADGVAAGISACVGGITEPAMYGINIPYSRPMGAAVAAAALSGILCGIAGVRGYVVGGSPSFLTVVTFIGGDDPLSGLLWGVVGGCVSVTASFILSYMLCRDPATAVEKGIEELGSGVAIEPTSGTVASPCDGVVTAVARTRHAVSITSHAGAQVLIHVGIDTAALQGKGFHVLVDAGERVLEGQKLLEFDLEYLKKNGVDATTPVVVSNAADFQSVLPCVLGAVAQGDELLQIWE